MDTCNCVNDYYKKKFDFTSVLYTNKRIEHKQTPVIPQVGSGASEE
jgi:hypothetical protein